MSYSTLRRLSFIKKIKKFSEHHSCILGGGCRKNNFRFCFKKMILTAVQMQTNVSLFTFYFIIVPNSIFRGPLTYYGSLNVGHFTT